MKVKIIDLISFVFIAWIILIPIAIPWGIIGFILYIARDMTYGLFIRSFIDSNYDVGEYIFSWLNPFMLMAWASMLEIKLKEKQSSKTQRKATIDT